MVLGRSRGADAVCFCFELLIRRNVLQNRNLHFDRKTPTRIAEFVFSVSENCRSSLFDFDENLINFDKAGFRVNDLKFSDFRVKDPRSTSSWAKMQFWHLVEIDRKVGRQQFTFIDFVSKMSFLP